MKIFILLTLIFTFSFSAPALQRERHYIQEDGSSFKAISKGDEHLHWIEDSQGNILKFNKKTANYDYAVIENDDLKASGEKYNKSKVSTRSLSKRVSKKELSELWVKKYKQKRLRKSISQHDY